MEGIQSNSYPQVAFLPPQSSSDRPDPSRSYSLDSISSFSDVGDQPWSSVSQQRQNRSRRRDAHNADGVKHKRTRTGCYTCRQRRVKCDESVPICDRCRKGKRECTYPSVPIATKEDRSTIETKSLTVDSGSDGSGTESDGDFEDRPLAIRDSAFPAPTAVTAKDDEPFNVNRSLTATTHSKSTLSGPKWWSLPEEVKTLLIYYQQRISHHHYAVRIDTDNFYKSTLLEIAMSSDDKVLLYAIVAFAAYHRTFEPEINEILPFLSHYNKAIVLLQQSLTRQGPNITILLAILQLTTIEEFLGDWETLMGHQKACCHIIQDLFTPETILQDETHRNILWYYTRSDMIAGMISSDQPRLGREWYDSFHRYKQQVARNNPWNTLAKVDELLATNRLLGFDFTSIVKMNMQQQLSGLESKLRSDELDRRLQASYREIQEAFRSTEHIDSLPTKRFDDISGLRDCHDMDLIYRDQLYQMNYVLLDFWCVELVHKLRNSSADGRELQRLAMKACHIVEAMQYSGQERNTPVFAFHAPLTIAIPYLPIDGVHINWARHMFAAIERSGCIYPAVFRQHMTGLWGVDVRDAWLDEEESNPVALKSLREFIDHRARKPSIDSEVKAAPLSRIWTRHPTDGTAPTD